MAQQTKKIIDKSQGNENVRMRKSAMKTEVGKVEDGKQELDKGSRILAAKILKAAEQPFKGLKPREAKAAVRKELERLIKDQHLFQRDIARMYGTRDSYVSQLGKWSGAKIPTRGDKSAALKAKTSGERRLELVKGRRGKLKPSSEREVEGETFGGGQEYYQKLWGKTMAKSGIDDEVGRRVLKRYKDEGRPLDPEDLAADLNVSSQEAEEFIKSLPKNGLPVEELKRRWMVPVESASMHSHKDFMESMEVLDVDLMNETLAVTEALNAIIELTT
jgi:biotin operon repressor